MRPVGKRRTREHVIADQSVCFVEWQALKCGFAVQRVFHDYGIDLEIDTFNHRGEIQAGTILMQVKATDHLRMRAGQASFGFRIERSHLVLWLSELEPVILIVYDAKKEVAYWICVQDYFATLPRFNLFTAGKTITVRVPVVNCVNAQSMRTFAMLRDEYRQLARRSHD